MTTLYDSLKSIEDVQALIDQKFHETEVLEYKTASAPFSDRDKLSIAKDVSAMANSLGGVIIYGVATDAKIKTMPDRIEDIDPKNIDAFERVLNAQVRPPIAGMRTKLIPPGAPRVLVVEVPPSEDPPHQNLYDKVYYRRSGSECLPMEHDLVAMHFGHRTGPKLVTLIDVVSPFENFPQSAPMTVGVTLRIFIENSGKRVARHVLGTFVFPSEEMVSIHAQRGSFTDLNTLYPGRQARQYSEALAVIHPSTRRQIADIWLRFTADFVRDHPEHALIEWTIHADEMATVNGSVSLRSLGLA